MPTSVPPSLQAVPQAGRAAWDSYFAGDFTQAAMASHAALAAAGAPEHLHVAGLALLAQGHVAPALPLLRAALHCQPQAAWFANCSVAALQAQHPGEALAFAEDGLARHDIATLHFARGNALTQLGRQADAAASFVRALELQPGLHAARLNLGNALRRLNRTEDALALYRQVARWSPDDMLAHLNAASALLELDGLDEARDVLTRILARERVPEAMFMLGTLRLSEGDLPAGFDLLRSRLDCAMAAHDRKALRRPLAESLLAVRGHHVLVSHEQGFGDSIQFIRYLPMIAAVAGRVSLLVPEPLRRLFAGVDHQVAIVASRDAAGDYRLECPMLHLPYLFGTRLDSIPASLPYLHVPEAVMRERRLPPPRVAGARKLGETGGLRPGETGGLRRVGLVWAGQGRDDPDLAAVDRRRSLHFGQIAAWLDLPGIDFVSLQFGPAGEQPRAHPEPRPMSVLRPEMDFLDTAAFIRQLDLVVSVDTAVAHLAGALGKPVWVLSRVDQCWRWMRGRDDSPWYPGVLRLFRQDTRGDWSGVVAAVRQALHEWSGNPGP